MVGIFPVKTKGKIVNSPHFWAIIVITLVLIFIYQAWPWREWKFIYGVWQWFPWLSSLYRLALVEFMNRIVGILFFVPIIYAAVVFSWRGALTTSLLSLGGVLPIIVDMWSINALITNMVLLLLPLFIVSIAAFELEWRRKEKKIFAEREEERRIYISKVFEAQDNERQRIARDLHDETIQTLLAVANSAETLVASDKKDISEIERNAAWIRDTTLSTADNLRRITLELRPSVLDDLGLVPALRWLVDRMNTECDIHTRIVVNGVERKLSPQAEVIMFRVVQEALNNIKRHSKANGAVITLEFAAEYLKITIQDDGQGFRPPKKIDKLADKGKLGLIGMQQRINFLDGTFQIRSRLGEGTLLLIKVKS
ncbi:MAG: sensor histidine kinase [Dehalococcoidia bacterium]|nr:sensor histidine kinase [Dehalococcoidia bacterium]